MHVAIFGPYNGPNDAPADGEEERNLVRFSFLLHASLDLFDACLRENGAGQSPFLGLLQMLDPRLSLWGWQSVSGARLAVIIDEWGKNVPSGLGAAGILRQASEGRNGRSAASRKVQSADVEVVCLT